MLGPQPMLPWGHVRRQTGKPFSASLCNATVLTTGNMAARWSSPTHTQCSPRARRAPHSPSQECQGLTSPGSYRAAAVSSSLEFRLVWAGEGTKTLPEGFARATWAPGAAPPRFTSTVAGNSPAGRRFSKDPDRSG